MGRNSKAKKTVDESPPEEVKAVDLGAKHFFTKAHAAKDGMEREVPADLAEYDEGHFRHTETGEVFAKKTVPIHKVRAGRTITLKNALSFWEGTPAEFRAVFDKV